MHKKRSNKVEVFITNIQDKMQSEEIRIQILKRYPNLIISFDLEDFERVLRIEGDYFNSSNIIEILVAMSFECEIMI